MSRELLGFLRRSQRAFFPNHAGAMADSMAQPRCLKRENSASWLSEMTVCSSMPDVRASPSRQTQTSANPPRKRNMSVGEALAGPRKRLQTGGLPAAWLPTRADPNSHWAVPMKEALSSQCSERQSQLRPLSIISGCAGILTDAEALNALMAAF